ncbi:MAG: hypothetical protein ABI639_09445 [Thermoanaerobaculia bacterium]
MRDSRSIPSQPAAAQPTREAQAQAEIAATSISPGGARILVGLLLATLLGGSCIEGWRAAKGRATAFAGGLEPTGPATPLSGAGTAGILAANQQLREGLSALEDRLARTSGLSMAFRPAAQRFLSRALSYGNSQVIIGRGGWLYFRSEFDYLTGPGFLAPLELARRRASAAARATGPPARFEPDPVPGLVQLRNELAELGIELVFFPVPVKAEIYPEPLRRRGGLRPTSLAASQYRFANPSYDDLIRRLAAAGVRVFDGKSELQAAAGPMGEAGDSLYLATDTHWSPAGMRVVSMALARYLSSAGLLPAVPAAGFRRRSVPLALEGDLSRLLGEVEAQPIFPHERVEIDEILDSREVPWSSAAPLEPATDLLLLGDSYSLVYAGESTGHTAGFGEQLAYVLDRPVQRLANFADNDLADRVGWLRETPQLLDGKRVLIYEVTARALASGNWTGATLQTAPSKETHP